MQVILFLFDSVVIVQTTKLFLCFRVQHVFLSILKRRYSDICKKTGFDPAPRECLFIITQWFFYCKCFFDFFSGRGNSAYKIWHCGYENIWLIKLDIKLQMMIWRYQKQTEQRDEEDKANPTFKNSFYALDILGGINRFKNRTYSAPTKGLWNPAIKSNQVINVKS